MSLFFGPPLQTNRSSFPFGRLKPLTKHVCEIRPYCSTGSRADSQEEVSGICEPCHVFSSFSLVETFRSNALAKSLIFCSLPDRSSKVQSSWEATFRPSNQTEMDPISPSPSPALLHVGETRWAGFHFGPEPGRESHLKAPEARDK